MKSRIRASCRDIALDSATGVSSISVWIFARRHYDDSPAEEPCIDGVGPRSEEGTHGCCE